ncbi:MAG: hypothetical protein K0R47_5967 [Brevibacillus sp.]|jgi:peptidoglycan hydrolase CwlO-like protein|nr:hypothetical protein [Brevibacillus sp.]
MKQALSTLEDLINKLEHRYNSFEEKLGYISDFLDGDIKDIVSAIEEGIEKIEELQDELDDANKKIDELERELNEAV